MIIVTGGAGFIGSAFVWQLNRLGRDDILVVDVLGTGEKWKNLVNLRYADCLHKQDFLARILAGQDFGRVDAVIHMGACSSTTETDADYLLANNVHYSQRLISWALEQGARVIHASSAATYGDGSQGFDDDPAAMGRLKPLNMYGYSKLMVDQWLARLGWPGRVASLKFFNVYGPNEQHKGDMKSVICKAFGQIGAGDTMRLFRSYRAEYPDGGQLRDFVYVKDCTALMAWLLEHPQVGGVYNVGTGRARTWNDLARAVFAAMGREPAIEYMDMPETLRPKYQYFTQARMERLRAAGYAAEFTSLEDGVADYVRTYLAADDPYLGNGRDS